MAATGRVSNTLSPSAVWFFSGGIVVVYTGSINLLNNVYGAAAPGLRWFCRIANVVMLCFTALSGVVTKASGAELAAVVGLFATVALLSWMRPSGNTGLRSNTRWS